MYAYRMVKIQSCFKVRIILPLKFLHHNFVLHCEIWHFLCAQTKTSMTTSLSYIFLSLLELLATILESPQYYPLVYFTAPVLYVKCKINQISCVYIFILFDLKIYINYNFFWHCTVGFCSLHTRNPWIRQNKPEILFKLLLSALKVGN